MKCVFRTEIYPLTKELIVTSKEVAEIVTEERLKEALGTFWVAGTTGKEVKWKGTDDLVSRVGFRKTDEGSSEEGFDGDAG